MEDFQFKPFDEMTPQDYAKIGFKSGLEIHQQLLTKEKLFCRCPAGHYSEDYHAEILRHMRPTLSELGEYDGTALMEFKTHKDIIYRINRETVCTYEMDDTPPFHCNPEALDIAFEVGMLYHANIVDEVHIARKQYLDGSIPTGFQRTAITSVGGEIPYRDRKIHIIQMSIEEDACREASDVGHRRVYMTDRLSMPLIETVTAPEMKTPQEIAEVNDILRRIVRSTGKVRTGAGATRQDVNISVTGGTRIEIKGVPSIKRIPLLAYNEAMRQWNLLKIKDLLNNRGVTAETFQAKIDDVTKVLHKTSYTPIFNAIAAGAVVKCVTLRNFKGILNHQTQTDTLFAREISDRVRVIACLTTLPNINYSDSGELTLSSAEGQKIRKLVGAGENDTMVLVWGSEVDTDTAAKEVIIRAKEATIGIPSETRQALENGTNGFERILPGPERMYPDTDLPPIEITSERLAAIRKQLPEYYWEKEVRYAKLDMPKEYAKPLAISKYSKYFDQALELGITPKIAGAMFIQFPTRLRRALVLADDKDINGEALLNILKAYKDGKIVRDMLLDLAADVAVVGEDCIDWNEIPKLATKQEFCDVYDKINQKMPRIALYNPLKRNDYMFGLIMDELRYRIDGKIAKQYFNELLAQGDK